MCNCKTCQQARRAEANMEAARDWESGTEPEICRGPMPQSEHGYRYLGDSIWIRGDVETTRWPDLIQSIRKTPCQEVPE